MDINCRLTKLFAIYKNESDINFVEHRVSLVKAKQMQTINYLRSASTSKTYFVTAMDMQRELYFLRQAIEADPLISSPARESLNASAERLNEICVRFLHECSTDKPKAA